jgi:uncharacterized protein (TIGR02646 family)
MHQLQRDPIPPTCLANYRHGVNQWRELSHLDREEIWRKLGAMQGERCAYCEATLGEARHIEHFRQQSRYAAGTFAWDNLFGSCDHPDSCGKHKDQCQYLPADLIKADIEDPERFLVFEITGTVQARSNLSVADRHKAEETIRILNLNTAKLKQTRRVLLMHFAETAEALAELARVHGDEAVKPLLDDELNKIATGPHPTAIKHILTKQSRA